MADTNKEKAAARRLAAFKSKLESLSAEEIQADLDAQRIRSAERRTLAEEIIAIRRAEAEAEEAVADLGEEEGAEPPTIEAEPSPSEAPAPSATRRFGKVLGMALSLTAIAWAIVRLVRR